MAASRLNRPTVLSVFSQRRLSNLSALKLLKRRWLNTDSTVGRFKREAAILAKLRHPNIVKIYNFGQHEDSYFIAMEYLSGRSLATILKSEEAIDLERVQGRWPPRF